MRKAAPWWILLLVLCTRGNAQTFQPIPVAGFNHDIFAEAGPNTQTVTDTVLDATQHIMYTQSFASAFALPAGLPDNGSIADASGTHTYQLAAYNLPNALTLVRNRTGILTVPGGGKWRKLSVLAFSTEGPSSVNLSVRFTDGSATQYQTGYNLADWFNSTTNVVISGFGRCQRMASAPYNPDGTPSNPRFYYIDFALSCADMLKTIQQIEVTNATTAGSNLPWPNTVLLALSGLPYDQTVQTTGQVQPFCTAANGSLTISVTGSTGPYTVSWGTTPVQTGFTATNLAAGSYTYSVTDANGCVSQQTATLTSLPSPVTVSAAAAPATLCNGESTQLSVSSSGGTLSSFTWSPGTLTGASVTVSPAATSNYTVTGLDQYGCTYTQQVTVTVNQPPAPPQAANASVCAGPTASLSVTNPQAGLSYGWYAAASGGTALATGTSYAAPVGAGTATYYLQATGSNGCVQAQRTPVTVTLLPPVTAPQLTGDAVCPGEGASLSVQNPDATLTYQWTATGNPSVLHTGPTFLTPSLTANTSFTVTALSAGGCTASASVTATILTPLPRPTVTVSAITSSSITFSWSPVSGATGYEVSTDGGLNYQAPSSGATGTSHTVTALTPGTSVTLLVRALGPEDCEDSPPSDPASGLIPDKNLFVPNVFTPNGDGHNDELRVFSNSIAKMDFKVFNQWGQQIFASTSPARGWDGTWGGKKQPVGVYVYTLEATLTDGTIIHKKGSVNLIR